MKCHVCNREFEKQESLDGHLQDHADGVFRCWECGEELLDEASRDEHAEDCEGSTSGDEHMEDCEGPTNRDEHIMDVERPYSEQAQFRCDKCGRVFLMPESFQKHMQDHADGLLKCPRCNQEFPFSVNREAHEQSCMGGLPHPGPQP